jgi:pimeloyl-ACP methyl ester carboxylesterase
MAGPVGSRLGLLGCGSKDGDRTDLVVVAQSLGGFTAPLVCDRLAVKLLVLVAPMIPAPGEAPADYWANTRYGDEAHESYGDPIELFYQDVPPELASEALKRGREQSEACMGDPSPLKAWSDVPTRVLICREDRLFPAAFLRRVARERLGISPDEIDGGHTPASAARGSWPSASTRTLLKRG